LVTGYWDPVDVGDARITEGFRLLRARRDRDLAGGAQHRGWKVGMNDGGIRDLLGIGSGVIGYLTDRTLSDGVAVPFGAGRLGAEVEVAFTIGDDGNIASAQPSIEVVDLRELDVTEALSLDVWHHAFVLGPRVPWVSSLLDELAVTLHHNNESIDVAAPGTDKLADLEGMLAFVRGGLELLGEALRAGDVILSGSLAPSIIWLQPGDEVRASIAPLGDVAARIS
jgi:2-keto-4-pentenoate hydratase